MDTEKTVQTLAKKVRSERQKRGLNQTELAELSGLSLNFVSQVELGKTTIRLDKLLQLLHSLGLEFKLIYGKKGISIET